MARLVPKNQHPTKKLSRKLISRKNIEFIILLLILSLLVKISFFH